jgi:hypothetical protein
MRALWPIEIAVLGKLAELNPSEAEALRLQGASAGVTAFENTGAGYFSDLAVDVAAPSILGGSPLGEVHAEILGVPHGMGFLLFFRAGKAEMLEGFCYAGSSTTDIDFERPVYALMPGFPHPR